MRFVSQWASSKEHLGSHPVTNNGHGTCTSNTDANNYERWWIERVFALVPAQTFVKECIDTFKEFPPRQRPAKFNVDDALSTLKSAPSN